jgi:hypothetical protein
MDPVLQLLLFSRSVYQQYGGQRAVEFVAIITHLHWFAVSLKVSMGLLLFPILL